MKKAILDVIESIGGNVKMVKGNSLKDDLLSITFDKLLYADFHGHFEIFKLEEFYNENKDLFISDKDLFVSKMLDRYFCITLEGLGQKFWKAELFTPFKSGTEDYKEWNDYFNDNDPDYGVNLTEINKVTGTTSPDFILLLESYGFPDSYYICVSDPNPDNPTVFGTDHEVFFREITNEGSLEDFLKKFLTKDSFVEFAFEDIEQFIQKASQG